MIKRSTRSLAKVVGGPLPDGRADLDGLRTHRMEGYVRSKDPTFDDEAVGSRYLFNPPEHVVVFGLDEKTSIQALDRED